MFCKRSSEKQDDGAEIDPILHGAAGYEDLDDGIVSCHNIAGGVCRKERINVLVEMVERNGDLEIVLVPGQELLTDQSIDMSECSKLSLGLANHTVHPHVTGSEV